jgi:hypothetical protein
LRAYTPSVFPIFPCVLGLLLGWAIWDRWLAQIATILAWALFLLPFAAMASLGDPTRDVRTLLLLAASFGLSIVLTEIGIRIRDRFERWRGTERSRRRP